MGEGKEREERNETHASKGLLIVPREGVRRGEEATECGKREGGYEGQE